jgi:hypothetical protein
MDSEFGRGYATCLIQFSFHRPRLDDDERDYARLAKEEGNEGLFTPAFAAEIWANGASDHLYEMRRPRSGWTKRDWYAADKLAERAIDIGHGFHASGKSSPAECRRLLDTADQLLVNIGVGTFEEAVIWDAFHGLAPKIGSWSCKEPMEHRPPK